MSDVQLSSSARTALIALVIFVDEASNPLLKERFGFKIQSPSVREELEREKLVTTRKGFRGTIFYLLTEDGWLRGRAELGEAPPTGAKPIHRMLYGALNAVNACMREHGLEMAHVFHVGEQDAPTPVNEQIRSAYLELAKRPGDLVSLARLRGELPRVERKELDETLIKMSRQKVIQLEPFANRLALPPEAKKAAVLVAGEAMHLIAFVCR